MPVTYTWEVTSIRAADLEGFPQAIVQTHWKKIGTDENGFKGEFQGGTPFREVTVPPEEFVPFDQLTEETVLGWIQSVVVGDYEQHVNDQIQKKIDQAKLDANPVSMPWAPQVTPTPVTGEKIAPGANNP